MLKLHDFIEITLTERIVIPQLPLTSSDMRGSFYVANILGRGSRAEYPYPLKCLFAGVSKISTEPAFTRSFLPFAASPFEVWSGSS